MKTFRHIGRYLAKFFLELEIFQTKVVEKIKPHILHSVTFFRKSHRLWHNVEKYGGDRGAVNYVTIRHIRVACWISKATCTYAQAHAHAPRHAHTHIPICNIYCFSTARMFRNSPQCYVVRALPVLFILIVSFVGRVSAVGIATRYGLESSGFESRWGREFLNPLRLTPGTTRHRVLFRG
jgi:hypothetical protein